MTIQRSILGVIPGLQSVALVGANVKMAKSMFPKNYKKFPKRPNYKRMNKNLIRGFATNAIGIPLIGATSSMVNNVQ